MTVRRCVANRPQSAFRLNAATNGLNSNIGTKRDMAISLIPFDRLDFRTLGYPQNVAPFSPPILGVEFRFCLASFSSEKSYSPSRLRCCQATAEPWPPRRETPPGWRYP